MSHSRQHNSRVGVTERMLLDAMEALQGLVAQRAAPRGGERTCLLPAILSITWQLVGMGLVLVSLLGWFTPSAESASAVAPTAYGDYRDYRDYHGYQDFRSYRRPRYERPDRFTIRKGKKCEIRCERIRGTRDYRCREYRC